MAVCLGCSKELTEAEIIDVTTSNGTSLKLLACSDCGTVKRKIENPLYEVKDSNGEPITTPFKYIGEYSSQMVVIIAKTEEEAKEKAFHHFVDCYYGVVKEQVYVHEIGKDVEILA